MTFLQVTKPQLNIILCIMQDASTRHSLYPTKVTSSAAIAEGPRDALSQLKSCQPLHNYEKIALGKA